MGYFKNVADSLLKRQVGNAIDSWTDENFSEKTLDAKDNFFRNLNETKEKLIQTKNQFSGVTPVLRKFKQQLTTGNFGQSKEDAEAAMMRSMGMGDDSDFDESAFDDSSIGDSDFKNVNFEEGDTTINNTQTNNIFNINGAMKSANKLTAGDRLAHDNMSIQSSIINAGFSQNLSALSNIGNTLIEIKSILEEKANPHFDASLEFYQASTSMHDSINKFLELSIEELNEMKRAREESAARKDKAYQLKEFSILQHAFGSINEQLDNFNQMVLPMVGETLSRISNDPLGLIVEQTSKALIDKVLERPMDKLRMLMDTANERIGLLFNKFSQSSNGFLSFIGNLFAPDMSNKRKVELGWSDEELKEKVDFDLKTHNTINTVIPMFLSKILNAIDGKGEQAFDHSSGKMINIDEKRKSMMKEMAENRLGMRSGQINNELAGFETIRKLSKEDREKFMITFMESMQDGGIKSGAKNLRYLEKNKYFKNNDMGNILIALNNEMLKKGNEKELNNVMRAFYKTPEEMRRFDKEFSANRENNIMAQAFAGMHDFDSENNTFAFNGDKDEAQKTKDRRILQNSAKLLGMNRRQLRQYDLQMHNLKNEEFIQAQLRNESLNDVESTRRKIEKEELRRKNTPSEIRELVDSIDSLKKELESGVKGKERLREYQFKELEKWKKEKEKQHKLNKRDDPNYRKRLAYTQSELADKVKELNNLSVELSEKEKAKIAKDIKSKEKSMRNKMDYMDKGFDERMTKLHEELGEREELYKGDKQDLHDTQEKILSKVFNAVDSNLPNMKDSLARVIEELVNIKNAIVANKINYLKGIFPFGTSKRSVTLEAHDTGMTTVNPNDGTKVPTSSLEGSVTRIAENKEVIKTKDGNYHAIAEARPEAVVPMKRNSKSGELGISIDGAEEFARRVSENVGNHISNLRNAVESDDDIDFETASKYHAVEFDKKLGWDFNISIKENVNNYFEDFMDSVKDKVKSVFLRMSNFLYKKTILPFKKWLLGGDEEQANNRSLFSVLKDKFGEKILLPLKKKILGKDSDKDAANTSLLDAIKDRYNRSILNPLKEKLMGAKDEQARVQARNMSFFDTLQSGAERTIFVPLKKRLLGTDDNNVLDKHDLYDSMKHYFTYRIMTPLKMKLLGSDRVTAIRTTFMDSIKYRWKESVTDPMRKALLGEKYRKNKTLMEAIRTRFTTDIMVPFKNALLGGDKNSKKDRFKAAKTSLLDAVKTRFSLITTNLLGEGSKGGPEGALNRTFGAFLNRMMFGDTIASRRTLMDNLKWHFQSIFDKVFEGFSRKWFRPLGKALKESFSLVFQDLPKTLFVEFKYQFGKIKRRFLDPIFKRFGGGLKKLLGKSFENGLLAPIGKVFKFVNDKTSGLFRKILFSPLNMLKGFLDKRKAVHMANGYGDNYSEEEQKRIKGMAVGGGSFFRQYDTGEIASNKEKLRDQLVSSNSMQIFFDKNKIKAGSTQSSMVNEMLTVQEAIQNGKLNVRNKEELSKFLSDNKMMLNEDHVEQLLKGGNITDGELVNEDLVKVLESNEAQLGKNTDVLSELNSSVNNLIEVFRNTIDRTKGEHNGYQNIMNDVTKARLLDEREAREGSGIGGNLLGALSGAEKAINSAKEAEKDPNVQKHAKGGAGLSGFGTDKTGGHLLNSPMLNANGKHLAGEAGPEAVLPMQRGSDGILGVKAINLGSTSEIINSLDRIYNVNLKGNELTSKIASSTANVAENTDPSAQADKDDVTFDVRDNGEGKAKTVKTEAKKQTGILGGLLAMLGALLGKFGIKFPGGIVGNLLKSIGQRTMMSRMLGAATGGILGNTGFYTNGHGPDKKASLLSKIGTNLKHSALLPFTALGYKTTEMKLKEQELNHALATNNIDGRIDQKTFEKEREKRYKQAARRSRIKFSKASLLDKVIDAKERLGDGVKRGVKGAVKAPLTAVKGAGFVAGKTLGAVGKVGKAVVGSKIGLAAGGLALVGGLGNLLMSDDELEKKRSEAKTKEEREKAESDINQRFINEKRRAAGWSEEDIAKAGPANTAQLAQANKDRKNENLVNATSGAMSGALNGAMMGAMFGPIGMAIGAVGGLITGFITNAGGNIGETLNTLWEKVKEIGANLIKNIGEMLNSAWTYLTEDLFPRIPGFLKDLGIGILKLPLKIGGWISDGWSKIFEVLKGMDIPIISDIESGVKKAKNWAGEKINKFLNWLGIGDSPADEEAKKAQEKLTKASKELNSNIETATANMTDASAANMLSVSKSIVVSTAGISAAQANLLAAQTQEAKASVDAQVKGLEEQTKAIKESSDNPNNSASSVNGGVITGTALGVGGAESSTANVSEPSSKEVQQEVAKAASSSSSSSSSSSTGGASGSEHMKAFISYAKSQGISDQDLLYATAQTYRESRFGTATSENMNYTTLDRLQKVFPKALREWGGDPATLIKNPEGLANAVYGSKTTNGKWLGNLQEGDGWKYRGRGLIGITGRAIYDKIGKMIGVDLVSNPDLLHTDPVVSGKATYAYFKMKNSFGKDLKGFTKSVVGNFGPGYMEKTIDGLEKAKTYLQQHAGIQPNAYGDHQVQQGTAESGDGAYLNQGDTTKIAKKEEDESSLINRFMKNAFRKLFGLAPELEDNPNTQAQLQEQAQIQTAGANVAKRGADSLSSSGSASSAGGDAGAPATTPLPSGSNVLSKSNITQVHSSLVGKGDKIKLTTDFKATAMQGYDPNTRYYTTPDIGKYPTMISGLDPQVRSNLNMMAYEYQQKTGKKLQVNTAFRTYAEQERLFKTLPPGTANRPGKSLHEFGVAVDITKPQAVEIDKNGLLGKYGFYRPLPNHPKEGHHVQAKGIIANSQLAGLAQNGDSNAPETKAEAKAQNGGTQSKVDKAIANSQKQASSTPTTTPTAKSDEQLLGDALNKGLQSKMGGSLDKFGGGKSGGGGAGGSWDTTSSSTKATANVEPKPAQSAGANTKMPEMSGAGANKPQYSKTRSKMNGINPDLIKVVDKAVNSVPFDVFVFEGLRDLATQQKYVKDGKSKTMKSYHLTGNAVDLYPMNPGTSKFPDGSDPKYAQLSAAMKKAAGEVGVNMTWGGDWKGGWDKPHYQLNKTGFKASGSPTINDIKSASTAVESAGSASTSGSTGSSTGGGTSASASTNGTISDEQMLQNLMTKTLENKIGLNKGTSGSSSNAQVSANLDSSASTKQVTSTLNQSTETSAQANNPNVNVSVDNNQSNSLLERQVQLLEVIAKNLGILPTILEQRANNVVADKTTTTTTPATKAPNVESSPNNNFFLNGGKSNDAFMVTNSNYPQYLQPSKGAIEVAKGGV